MGHSDASVEEPLLEAKGVTFQYPRATHPTVVDASVSVRAGERCALIGPNGSGKSTLLSLLAGLNQPISGEVRLQGEPTTHLRRRQCARRVALMPQVLPPVPGVTVRELVAQGRYAESGALGMLRHSAGTDAATERCLVATGVQRFASRQLDSLSGGERQRVRLALALRQHAPLVLLDEPLAHLDIHHQFDMLDVVAEVTRDQGLGVVAVLHELDLAVRWAERMIVVEEGRIIADGAPADVLQPELLRRVFYLDAQVNTAGALDIRGRYRGADPKTGWGDGSPELIPVSPKCD